MEGIWKKREAHIISTNCGLTVSTCSQRSNHSVSEPRIQFLLYSGKFVYIHGDTGIM